MRVSKSDFEGWWASPVGQEVRAMLRNRINMLCREALTSGVIRDQLQGAELLGRKNEIISVLSMDYNDFETELGELKREE